MTATYEKACKPPPCPPGLHHKDCRWYPAGPTHRTFPSWRSAYWACSNKCQWYWQMTINNMAKP